jgi:arsenate reductase
MMDRNATPQDTAHDDSPASRALDRNVLARTAAHLYERYAHVVDRETVERVVQESYEELERTAAVKTYLTASAGNFADSRLRALSIARGALEARNPRVLFVDDENAGRSQMAASLVLKHTEGRITARSAGLAPAGSVHDAAVQVMAEVGVHLEHAYPKPLADDIHRAAQLVVTLACADRVERVDGVEYRDWDIPSLEGSDIEDVRRVRDDIDARVRELIAELGHDAGS